MDVNLNNSQINTFTGGMNSDTSLDQVQDNQYLFGVNIRISNNTVIFEEPNSNNKEGIVCPIRAGMLINLTNLQHKDDLNDDGIIYDRILAVDSIKDFGIIILKDRTDRWNVFRILYYNEEYLLVNKLFTSTKKVKTSKRFSVVLNEETKDMIKLYIANGEDEILQIFVKYNDKDDMTYISNINNNLINEFKSPFDNKKLLYTKEDLLKSNYIFPTKKLKIAQKIAGSLQTSLILYTYRFYKKNGIVSKLSPLTNKIQVINDSKHSENGCAEDTTTNIGFLLNIPCNKGFSTLFDRLLIYRLDYIKPKQNAEVNLIYDGELVYETGDKISINDIGQNSLLKLTIEEFASLNGQDTIPKTIESTLGYMFASNIKDKSSIYLSLEKYNPRAYQFNKDGYCILYKDNDITYLQTPYKSRQYPKSLNDIKTYTHNKSSDVNYTGNLFDDCCFRTDKILGGEGPNISWKFIIMDINVHLNVKNIKQPDLSTDPSNLNSTKIYSYKLINGKLEANNYTTEESKYLEEKYVYNDRSYDYNSIIGSSLCRSLLRNEVYRYGIIFYDERGIRTDVLWIADIRTPSIKELSNFAYHDELESKPYILVSRPLGILFDVTIPVHPDPEHVFVGYEIVRCEKNYSNTYNILQIALSTPVHLLLPEIDNDTAYSPYYPSGLLTTNKIYIRDYIELGKYVHKAENIENSSLYQIFNPQILYQRQDILQQLQNINLNVNCIKYMYGNEIKQDSKDLIWGNFIDRKKEDAEINLLRLVGVEIAINKQALRTESSYQMRYKLDKTTIFNLYKGTDEYNKASRKKEVIDIQDVKNPTWEEGFTNIKFDSDARVATAVSAYKSFITSIQNETYINWACCAMYDITTGTEDEHGTWNDDGLYRMFINSKDGNLTQGVVHARLTNSHGYIGPGPVCFLMKTNGYFNTTFIDNTILSTAICLLLHDATQFAGLTEQEKQYDVYYGFGNFVEFTNNNTQNKVFDGDIYNIPCEFTTLFKTYDFNCLTDALPSTLIVYYVPMESRINTFFDYGMNFKNTTNPNLLLEPGRIDGVSSLTRPLHQINMVYSDNSNSNNMFNVQTLEKNTELFLQRILYSLLKTNGENIDNWLIFKAIDFIDVDSRYGLITNLLSVNDILYFWLEQAFGKLSVNERSLVTDTNNNIVLLGQAGVLLRSDYLDTKHGLREYDYAAINIGPTIFWIDVLNKCIVAFSEGRVINYSEYKNVQNIVNTYCIDESVFNSSSTLVESLSHLPTIHYDVQNDELLCNYMYGSISPKSLKIRMQLVFNTKLNIASSMYTREYENILNLNGRLYGIHLGGNVTFTKYNHLYEKYNELLKPTVLHFVVNKSASDTKVYDNLKIVTLKKQYTPEEQSMFFEHKILYFDTDLNSSYKKFITNDLIQNNSKYYQITNRESNLQYSIPRETLGLNNNPIEDYGKRLRGKWMLVYMYDKEPKLDYSISHIITKFRKSFS